MMLGDKECDWETAHILKYGTRPKIKKTCIYGLTENDIDYHMHKDNVNEFDLWRGTRIPCWFE